MASDDTIAGVLARLLVDKPHKQDEHSAPALHTLWMEHLTDVDDRDAVAACRALLEDGAAHFPTIGEFRDECQIQGRDRLAREAPPDVGARPVCVLCGDLRYVFVAGPYPWTVRPCECNERQYELWMKHHYRSGHLCPACSASMARTKRAPRTGRKPSEPAKPQVPPEAMAPRAYQETF